MSKLLPPDLLLVVKVSDMNTLVDSFNLLTSICFFGELYLTLMGGGVHPMGFEPVSRAWLSPLFRLAILVDVMCQGELTTVF